VRQLYTDNDEVLFDAARPIILNGIDDFVTRPDLADRSIILTLEAIPDEDRRPEKELWGAFEIERPRILGALSDAVACGMRRLPCTKLEKLPRMADFALWATACEEALWRPGSFRAAYINNRDETIQTVIEGDCVADAVRSFMAGKNEWSGKASALLALLSCPQSDPQPKGKYWPTTPRALACRLRRLAAFLRKTGIEIEFRRERGTGARIVHIGHRHRNREDFPSQLPQPSHAQELSMTLKT
jgi:hypothetical protein